MIEIDSLESAAEFLDYLQNDKPIIERIENNIIYTSEYGSVLVHSEFTYLLNIATDYTKTSTLTVPKLETVIPNTVPEIVFANPYQNHFIYGKNETEQVIAVEIIEKGEFADVRMYLNDGSYKDFPYNYWILSPIKYDETWSKLEGNTHYKWIKLFAKKSEFSEHLWTKQKYRDYYVIFDEREAAMVFHGITLFKGMKPQDLSIVSFDLETNGLTRDNNSKVFMISNTARDKFGTVSRKTFILSDYNDSSIEMIRDWCAWICAVNPTILAGHNVYGYDFDFLRHICELHGEELCLGSNGSATFFHKKDSKFRVDGSNDWFYKKIKIHGRHIIDTMFLSVRYDIGRAFPSWKLKEIVDFKVKELQALQVKEKKKFSKKNLELLNKWNHGGKREFYDASKIRENWYNLEEQKKIIMYGEHDSDDALNLFDLMCPSFFYLSQTVPKPFGIIGTSASGSQLNAFLVRSYLQNGESVPKATEVKHFEGAISFGIPGVYKNCFKIDIQQLYPSIIMQYSIFDEKKDPKQNFLKMVNFFTKQRMINKKLAKQTNEQYYSDLEQAQKICCNSSYGVLGAYLNFNSPEKAELITKYGREILNTTTLWATGENLEYWIKKQK